MAKISCVVTDQKTGRSVEVFAPDMMEIALNRVKSPWFVPPITAQFASGIGKVALVWASFEHEIDAFLSALVKASNYTSSTEWKKQRYAKRADIFRNSSKAIFENSSPSVWRYIDSLLGRAANLQPKRNILAHGRLQCVLEVVGPDLDHMRIVSKLHAQDDRTNKTETFDPESLEKLYYELAHLSGLTSRLNRINDPPKRIALRDRASLRDFLLAHHPSYASGQTPAPPLGSSQG
jgi:hypothetical protein